MRFPYPLLRGPVTHEDSCDFWRHLPSGGDDVHRLRDAADLLQSEALDEDRYEDWAAPVRDRVHRTWRDVCLRIATLQRAGGSRAEALRQFERVLERDSLDEDAMRGLLSTLGEMGRTTEALRRYERFARHLASELDVPPDRETAVVVEALRQRLAHSSAGLPEVEAETQYPIVTVEPSYPLIASTPLVGRTDELSTLLHAMAVSESQSHGKMSSQVGPRLIVVTGEAGMGKTRLLAEIAALMRRQGALLLAGGCYEQEGKLPYGPIHDALLDYVRVQPAEALAQQFGELLTQMSLIVPEIRVHALKDGNEPVVKGESQRLQLFATVAQALERISRNHPLVLILDDLQWADAATLQLLHFLIRQRNLNRVRIVGSYRPEEIEEEHALPQLVVDSVRNYGGTRLHLTALKETHIALLLEHNLSARCSRGLAQELYERSDGNPFFVVQMLNLMQNENGLERTAEGWRQCSDTVVALPDAVRHVIGRRLRGLDSTALEGLTLGAVLGREFSHAALEAVWDADEQTLFSALDTALDAQLLNEIEDGYAFRHPLLREVVYSGVNRQRRSRLHWEVGLALERLYGDRGEAHATELAHHFVAARHVDDPRAARYLTYAGDRAARAHAWDEASQLYAEALSLSQGSDPPPSLQEKLGTVLAAGGLYREALDLLRHAADSFAHENDLPGLARAVTTMGRVYFLTGEADDGIIRLEPVLEMLRGPELRSSLAAVYAMLARLFELGGRYGDQLAAAEHASRIAQSIGDSRTLAEAEMARALAIGSLGDQSTALDALQKAMSLAEKSNDPYTLSRTLGNIAERLAGKAEFASAVQYANRAVDVAERLGDPAQRAFSLFQRGRLCLWSGDWDQMRLDLENAEELTRELGPSSQAPYALYLLGTLCLYRDERDAGLRYFAKAIALATTNKDPVVWRFMQKWLAEDDVLEGHPEAAVERLEPFVPEGDAWLLSSLAWAYLEMGDEQRAMETADRAIERAAVDKRGMILHRIEALRAMAMVLGRRGAGHDAECLFTEALTLARGIPFMEGRLLHEYGVACTRRHERERAKHHFNEALSIFQRLGARQYARRTEQALAGPGYD